MLPGLRLKAIWQGGSCKGKDTKVCLRKRACTTWKVKQGGNSKKIFSELAFSSWRQSTPCPWVVMGHPSSCCFSLHLCLLVHQPSLCVTVFQFPGSLPPANLPASAPAPLPDHTRLAVAWGKQAPCTPSLAFCFSLSNPGQRPLLGSCWKAFEKLQL